MNPQRTRSSLFLEQTGSGEPGSGPETSFGPDCIVGETSVGCGELVMRGIDCGPDGPICVVSAEPEAKRGLSFAPSGIVPSSVCGHRLVARHVSLLEGLGRELRWQAHG